MFFRNVFMKIKNLTNKLMHNSKPETGTLRSWSGKIMNRSRGSGLRPLKPANSIYILVNRSWHSFRRRNRLNRIVLIGCLCLIFIALGLSLPKLISRNSEPRGDIEAEADDTPVELPRLPVEKEEPEQQPKQITVIDISGGEIELKPSMIRINEPVAFGREVLYSAGSTRSIDEPVFTKLFIYNLDTGEEKAICETEIKYGEIYEGRFNDKWIVWLDTNQSGTNNIYAQNRRTEEIFQVKRCDLNKPQLVLDGDNLVWVEQKNEEEDRLYLFNFESGEPVSLESFNNPTYGTCPPALRNNVLVWVYPHPRNPEQSIIKKLNLEEALFFNVNEEEQQELSNEPDEPEPPDETASGNEADDLGEDSGEMETGENSENNQDEPVQGDQDNDDVIQPVIIDPNGFAIYPQTNGEVIAWLDNLDPSKAKLMMTRDDGKTITAVAENVGRLFGVGDKFIVYTQNDAVMLYFWENDCYARLTGPGQKGMLSKSCVIGNAVVWCNADNPGQEGDIVYVSIVEQP